MAKFNFSKRMVLFYGIITVLLFGGFLSNFLSFHRFNTGTIIVDILIGVCFIHLTYILFSSFSKKKPLNETYKITLQIALVLFLLTFIKALFLDHNPFFHRILGLRNNLLYGAIFLYLPYIYQKESQANQLINYIIALGSVLSIFAIIQFLYSEDLPLSLLALKGDNVFSFWESNIIRPTALVGNTIIFASLTVILFAISFVKLLYHPKPIWVFTCIISLTANILTITRASVVGVIIIILVATFMYYVKPTLRFVASYASAVLITSGLIVAIAYQYKDSFYVRRMLGQEVTTKASTQEHFLQIENAITSIRQTNSDPLVSEQINSSSPSNTANQPQDQINNRIHLHDNKVFWWGTGVGSQGPSSGTEGRIVTDGFWFQILLENGLPLGILYILCYVSSFLYALKLYAQVTHTRLKQFCLIFISISIYFFLAGFINSALAGKPVFILYWIIFGFIITLQTLSKKLYAFDSH